MSTLGERIKYLRTIRKLTQEILAEKLKITKQSISGWERNIASPDPLQLCTLADYFNVSVDYLLVRTEFSEPVHPIGQKDNIIWDLKVFLLSNRKIELQGYPLSQRDRKMFTELMSSILYYQHQNE